jgi:hypothetical protein
MKKVCEREKSAAWPVGVSASESAEKTKVESLL